MFVNVSVIVLTYNPDMSKLINTIKSILMQKDCSYEIVIADDGSKENYFKEVKAYLQQKSFDSYTLVENKRNQGTVKNFESALKVAKGLYIKAISPGDYLFEETSLCKIFNYAVEHDYKVCFGKAVYYSYIGDELQLYNKHNPNDLQVYRNKNRNKILKNYFYYQDYVLGAGLFFEKKTIIQYIKMITKYVTYAEDTSILCMLADGLQLGFFDEYIIWYEYGSGISTSSNNEWRKIIFGENKRIFEILAPKSKLIKKAYKYNYCGFSNRYLNIIRKIIISPLFLKYGISYMLRNKFGKEHLEADILRFKEIDK